MSQTTQPATNANGGQPAAQQRKRRSRSPSAAKPAFVILQLLDDSDQPMPFDKRKVKVVAVERSAEKVMEAMEDGSYPNAFYLRVVVPAGTRAGSPNVSKASASVA